MSSSLSDRCNTSNKTTGAINLQLYTNTLIIHVVFSRYAGGMCLIPVGGRSVYRGIHGRRSGKCLCTILFLFVVARHVMFCRVGLTTSFYKHRTSDGNISKIEEKNRKQKEIKQTRFIEIIKETN